LEIREYANGLVRQCFDILGCRSEVCEEKINDDAASSEFAGSFMLWIKEHAEKSWEDGTFNLTQLLESEISCAQTLEAEQSFVE